MKKLSFISSIFVAFVCLMLTSCAGEQISKAIEVANKQCPMTLAPGLTMEKISDEGQNVTYHYLVDENRYVMDDIKAAYEAPGANSQLVADMRSDHDTAEFFDLVKAAGKNIQLTFTGSNGNSFNVVIENSEF